MKDIWKKMILLVQNAMRKLNKSNGSNRVRIMCDASLDSNYSAYIHLNSLRDRTGIVSHTVTVDKSKIMVDIGHNGEVVGIEILGEKRMPSILKQYFHKVV